MGSYDAYAVPRRGYITKVERDGDVIRLAGDIELVQKHMRSYDIVRKPLASIAVDIVKRALPECRYIVIDEDRRVVLAGQIPVAADASFYLDLGSMLPAGRFTLRAQLIVNGNAMNAEIRDFPIEALER